MLKVFAIEFNSNLSVELWGEKRQNFKKGNVVVITRDDRLKLLRLGCTQIAEKELTFKDVFDKDDIKDFAKIDEERRRSRLYQETPVDVAPETTETEEEVETTSEAEEVEEGTPEGEPEAELETEEETVAETEDSAPETEEVEEAKPVRAKRGNKTK